ncbi:MAG: hypothetical protein JXB30_02525 [Anaerolineae bacterium]|nr:hypothetical protein [Anaerolineae bacterium]
MWLKADYEPVAAFGLRPSNTTSSGGKSLICPTPYAIKMALLDRMIRNWGLSYGLESFDAVRDLRILARVPLAVAVNRTFQKVLRPGGDPWISTIAQREYCFFAGVMTLAFETPDEQIAADLPGVLAAVNYFGRRGSFMQFLGCTVSEEEPTPGDGFIDLSQPSDVPALGFLQRMDDMRSNATFDDVSVFSTRRSDGGRTSHTVVFPYQLDRHGFNHTVYVRRVMA